MLPVCSWEKNREGLTMKILDLCHLCGFRKDEGHGLIFAVT